MKLCSIGIHKWSKYEVVAKGEMKSKSGWKRPAIIQERKCIYCGKIDQNIVYPK